MERKVSVVVKKSSPISSGLVYTFVHETFEEYESRYGSQADVLNIQKCFEALGLKVMAPYINFSASQVMNALDEASQSDFGEYECIIVIIITHFFKLGELLSKQKSYVEDDVIDYFKGDRCPGLIGKPKMFFFQASKCQERLLTKPDQLCATDGSSPFVVQFTLPNEADIFAFRSSYEGGPSHKPENTGSWVIKNLCQRLENLDGSVTLLEAMTALLNDIKSNRSGEPSIDPYKALPEMTSSLIQNVYFKNSSLTSASSRPSSYKKSKKMGIFYVFNYNNVYDKSTRDFLPRVGTTKDIAYIKKCFTKLGFEVKVEHDLRKEDLFNILRKAPDFTDDTCVAVAVLTHGFDGFLGTSDMTFSEQELFHEFSFKQRTDLIGKPKLFFLQVCRGDKITGYSTVEYVKHEETNTEIGMSVDELKVESIISDEKRVPTDGCATVVGMDYPTNASDIKGITTVDDVKKITSVNNIRKGTTVTRGGRIVTTVSDIDGNTTVDTMESLSNVSNEDDVTKMGDLKSVSTVNDTKNDATTNMSRNIETDARRAGPVLNNESKSSGSSAPKNIDPLEDDDILVVHSTYANTPSHRDTESGSWFIQDLCYRLELLTNDREISLLDAVSEVQKHIAENRSATILNELHKQMPVISSTLTQRLMLGPSIELNT